MKCSMGGYKLVAISGIDSNFTDFTKLIESYISCNDCLKIPYDRTLTFVQNIEAMRTIIGGIRQKCCLIGWSIGAVAAAFLSDCVNVNIVVMINPFYKRSEILKRRNIFCDEEVCISSTIAQPVLYIIIAGIQDDKIPYTESLKIAKYYNISNAYVYLIEDARHRLDSFPLGKISDIINRYIL